MLVNPNDPLYKKAYGEGVAAFADGKNTADCPYDLCAAHGSDDYKLQSGWVSGLFDAPGIEPMIEGYWYTHRDELNSGMIFNSSEGVVKLDGSVPGDATKWYAATRFNGQWTYEDATVEASDLIGAPIEDVDAFEEEQKRKRTAAPKP